MAIEDWELTGDGEVKIAPLLDFVIADAQLVVIARLHTAHRTEEPTKPEARVLQLGMTPAQARQLGQHLLEAVHRIERRDVGNA